MYLLQVLEGIKKKEISKTEYLSFLFTGSMLTLNFVLSRPFGGLLVNWDFLVLLPNILPSSAFPYHVIRVLECH